VPAILSGLKMLVRNEKNPDSFQQAFRQWIFEFRDEALASRRTEAERLLEQNDPDGALISAVALLETELNQRLGKPKSTKLPRQNHTALISKAVEEGILRGSDYGKLANAVRARNDFVHRQVSVHRSEAADYVKTILEVVGRLPPMEGGGNEQPQS